MPLLETSRRTDNLVVTQELTIRFFEEEGMVAIHGTGDTCACYFSFTRGENGFELSHAGEGSHRSLQIISRGTKCSHEMFSAETARLFVETACKEVAKQMGAECVIKSALPKAPTPSPKKTRKRKTGLHYTGGCIDCRECGRQLRRDEITEHMREVH